MGGACTVVCPDRSVCWLERTRRTAIPVTNAVPLRAMDEWSAVLGGGGPPPPKRAAVSSGKTEMERELLVIVARLSVKNAREIREIANLAYGCFRLPAEADVVKRVEAARKQHADRTRGQSGHKEGAPDEYAFVAMLLVIREEAQALAATKDPKAIAMVKQIDLFLSNNKPKDGTIAAIVGMCKLNDMHVSTHKKLFLKLRDPELERVCAEFLCTKGERMWGQAPRGSLERKAMDLMQKLGVKTDEKVL